MARVGEKIKRLREDREWTQPRLAVEAGVAVSAVSQIENGRRSPNVGTLDKLARALSVEVADLFKKVDSPKGREQQPSLDAAVFSEALQEALAVLLRGLARRGRRIVEQSVREGASEHLSRDLVEYQAEAVALLRIKGKRDIYGRDSEDLAEAEEAYREVEGRIQGLLEQDVFGTRKERAERLRFKPSNQRTRPEEEVVG